MGVKLTDAITWVGKIDWELRKFHGEEYSTHRGSSYNSYLIRDEKTVLVDTVWSPYDREFVASLAREVDLSSIDYVVCNHAEPDHAGSLAELMRHIPGKPIYCSNNCVKSLKGQFHLDLDFHPVKTGDKLSLGSKELIFVEAPMLHWPDSMFCYLTGEEVLLPNDAFGQHLATEHLWADLVDPCELWQEAIKYYANILTPFSPMVKKKIQELLGLGLPVKMILPSHGSLWRKDPLQIVNAYAKWADDYQEDQVAVVYDTMWNATRRMAEAIAEGVVAASPSTTVKVFNIARSDKNDVITEIFKSKAVLVGSSTINRGFLSSVAGLLEEMRGLGFKKKKAAAFGSYGWSGEATKMITERLREGGFEIVSDGHKQLWVPDGDGLEACRAFGREFAGKL